MIFVDTVTLHLQSGNGGPGAVSFLREKYMPKGGPDGGDGGNGGNIIFLTSSRMHSLIDLKSTKKKYKSESGKHGMGKKKSGSAGRDLEITIPTGTRIYDENNNLIVDLNKENMRFIVAKGGKGGKGNAQFATSINRSPRTAQPGIKGEALDVRLELRLLADVGLVGLPNAGKSSLLNCVTQSNSKIGDYPFTTLFPNLGTLKTYNQEIILADIPGLIQGASKGQGLGHEFLRHVDRTSVIVHLVAVDANPDTCWDNYSLLLTELKESEYQLLDKTHIVVLSKSDMLTTEQNNAIVEIFQKHNISTFPISSFTNEGISTLIEKLSGQVRLL